MRNSFFSASMAVALLAACSPAQYKLNPATSQEQGYMKILGDLRWDNLTSSDQWVERFPGCQSNLIVHHQPGYTGDNSVDRWVVDKSSSSASNWIQKLKYVQSGELLDPKFGETYPSRDPINDKIILTSDGAGGTKKCGDFQVGGISLTPERASFSENSGTKSKFMMTQAIFGFFDDSSSRAFKSAIAQKYDLTTSGYCSKFTCWDLDDVDKAGVIKATPTPYAISLLDNVKVKQSDI